MIERTPPQVDVEVCLEEKARVLRDVLASCESLLVAFNEDYTPRALMAEAAHGTAPALKGKDVANPMAMILAGAALLSHIDDDEARTAGRAIREAALEAVSSGVRTADLAGHATTTEFTDEVISRIRSKLEVWATLGEG